MVRSKWLILFFGLLAVYIVCNRGTQKGNMYLTDVSGYYIYLPAALIYHDVGHMEFHQHLSEAGAADDVAMTYLLKQSATGMTTDKYPLGTSLFELPCFAVAHVWCMATGSSPANGYSLPYQWAGILSTILWAMAALWVLRGLLLRYYSDGVTAMVLLCLALGTNFYYYTAFTQGMSHAFSFFLLSAILAHTDSWYRTGQRRHVYWLGLLLGLVFVVRPVNVVVAVVPLLWAVDSGDAFIGRLKLLRTNAGPVIAALTIAMAIAALQMAYWKYTSGHWLYYSYTGEHFDFLRPRIGVGLFSFRKGWFVYTPIALVGMLGFVALWQRDKRLVPALLLYFALAIYTVFSWKNWWYGGGFGCRPLIDSLPMLALPLGALVAHVAGLKRVAPRAVLYTLLSLFVALNMFQTFQFSKHIIHHDRMSWGAYWYVFGKTQVTFDELEPYLMNEKEYWRQNFEMSAE